MNLPYGFRNTGRQLTEKEVAGFEADIGAPLSGEYRSLLLAVNGGYPQNEGFDYGDGCSFALKRLFPLTDETEKHFNLRSLNLKFKDAPSDLLVIGISSFGDNLCLGIRGSYTGKVFWIDHEERDPDEAEEDEWLGVSELSPSFGEFMQSLKNLW